MIHFLSFHVSLVLLFGVTIHITFNLQVHSQRVWLFKGKQIGIYKRQLVEGILTWEVVY